MCGIYGITAKDEPFIKNYITTCKHRGPDGQSIWSDDFVTLGHNLLAITEHPDVSTQPWITPRGNVLIYNGEIFNYYELCAKFNDFVPRTTCDTELLAWGLDEHGIGFLDIVDSMHGFAYYNVEAKKIWLSRDHAGIKPLYYAQISEGLVFGSEIKGMLDKVPNAHTVDEMAMSCYSHCGTNVTRHSFFSNVKKLMCGETIEYNIEHKTLTQIKRNLIYPNADNDVDYEEFRQTMHESVKMCSIGKRQIGVFLSGGIDSTMVAYELNKIQPPAWTFTNQIDPLPQADENFNSDAQAAGHLATVENFNHTFVNVTPEVYYNSWDNAMYYMEQPVYNGNLPMYYHTNKFLSEHGVVVTMAGDMGDEVLAGYPAYWKLRRDIQQNPKEFDSQKKLVMRWLNKLKRPPNLPGMRYSREDICEELLQTTFTNSIYNNEDPVASYMSLDATGLCPEDFFGRNDRYGMAFSMEGRFPLATKKFMRYCMNIKTAHKMGKQEHETKRIPRTAYKGYLPDKVINKEKTGWTAPALFWSKQKMDKNMLKTTFNKSFASPKHNIKGLDKEPDGGYKGVIPGLMTSDWATKYNMTI